MSDSLTRASMPPAKSGGHPLLPAGDTVTEFLAFCVGSENYALPLSAVREIMAVPPITEVPRAPPAVMGIVSVRGRVTTVLDARRRLSMGPTKLSSVSRLLLVACGQETMGLVVDRILQVFRLSEDQVEHSAKMGSDTADHIVGVGRAASRPSSLATQGRRPLVQAPDEEDLLLLILLDPDLLIRD